MKLTYVLFTLINIHIGLYVAECCKDLHTHFLFNSLLKTNVCIIFINYNSSIHFFLSRYGRDKGKCCFNFYENKNGTCKGECIHIPEYIDQDVIFRYVFHSKSLHTSTTHMDSFDIFIAFKASFVRLLFLLNTYRDTGPLF